MQITKSAFETAIGPSDWFTGAVYIDAVAAPPAPNRAQDNLVHFTQTQLHPSQPPFRRPSASSTAARPHGPSGHILSSVCGLAQGHDISRHDHRVDGKEITDRGGLSGPHSVA